MLPQDILLEGIKQMVLKIKNFMTEFEKSMSSQESTIEIRESKVLMKAFDIVIEGENHTLGHLLQSYINTLFKQKNIFVGYMNPHPLESKIIFRINVETLKGLNDLLTQTCDELIKQCDILSNLVLKEFKKKIIFNPVSKKSPKGKGKAKAKDEDEDEDEDEAKGKGKGKGKGKAKDEDEDEAKGKGKGKAKPSTPKEKMVKKSNDNEAGPA